MTPSFSVLLCQAVNTAEPSRVWLKRRFSHDSYGLGEAMRPGERVPFTVAVRFVLGAPGG